MFALFVQPGERMHGSAMTGMGVEEVVSLTRERLTYRVGDRVRWTSSVHVQGLFETEDQAYAARLAAKRAYDTALEDRGDPLGDAKRAIKAAPGYANPREAEAPSPARPRR